MTMIYHLEAGVLKKKGRPSVNVPPELQLVDPSTPAGVQPLGIESGFTVNFSDEFDGTDIDSRKWLPWYPDVDFWNTTVPGGHRSNTSEPQAYDPSGVSVANGLLTLTIRDEETVPGLPFTSGMICSAPSYATAYGFFEARMKLNNYPGSWPAFWLFPENHVWPPEIDIMENWGGSFNFTVKHANIWPGGVLSTPYTMAVEADSWHTYGVHWEPGRTRFYVDGVLTWDYQSANVSATRMYVICNLAGDKDNWPLAAHMPFDIQVDYIRVWK